MMNPHFDIGKLYLERTNEFAVTTVASASAALDRIKSNGIQAIVSDYQIPGDRWHRVFKTGQGDGQDHPVHFVYRQGQGRDRYRSL